MFICTDCGHVFEEPEVYAERHPYGDTYAEETFSCCPNCGGGYDEAVRCSHCDTYIAESDMYDDVCEKCKKEVIHNIAKAIAGLFTKDEFDDLPDDIFDDIFSEVEAVYREEGNN
jgi:hypothetical protein